ncbi:DUF4124 domain-containing protein [Arhodomonas sp. SL1]|uniref:DUF4124 domain-containing protein n=1 Tax=Arhodomonas sp. SL1 TaxID=3425691 RepID=UPI003F883AB9
MAGRWCSPRWLLAAVLALAVLAAADVQARSYKWVDDEGRVHYSDSIPAEEAQKRRERELKSERGLTIERLEPPPTREALEARARAEARAEEQARREAERRERDRVLLRTYDSLAAMERARDERLAVLDGRIRLARDRVERLERRHEALSERAAAMERSGSGDLDKVYREIESVAEQVREQRAYIERQREEQAAIRARFELDMQRFRELSGAGDG